MPRSSRPDAATPRLRAAMRYGTLGGGKRLRPLLVYAGGSALGAPLEWMVAALIAMALIPVVYSLVYYKWLERHGRIDTP